MNWSRETAAETLDRLIGAIVLSNRPVNKAGMYASHNMGTMRQLNGTIPNSGCRV